MTAFLPTPSSSSPPRLACHTLTLHNATSRNVHFLVKQGDRVISQLPGVPPQGSLQVFGDGALPPQPAPKVFDEASAAPRIVRDVALGLAALARSACDIVALVDGVATAASARLDPLAALTVTAQEQVVLSVSQGWVGCPIR